MSAAQLLSYKKTYELPLAKDYVRHWGLPEAVRELIQNALDSDSPFEYELGEDFLKVHSRFSTLPVRSLLLGQTTKADNKSKIGSFGEGYKIALLVLTRGKYRVRVLNGDRVWTPVFVHNKQFDAEVLCIEDRPAERKNEGITFEVRDLSPSDIEAIRESCLFMQDNVGSVYSTQYGCILNDRPGKLYVGGLYVCDTELGYGYDVKPEYLQLERDRQTVSNFDLKWLTKDIWFDTERFEQIASLMEAQSPDLEYAHHGTPALVKEACYQLFQQNYPGHIAAKTQEELKALVERGMTKTIVVGGAYGEVVRSSSSYQSSGFTYVPPTPTQRLTEFFEKFRPHMRTKAIVEFKKVLETSKGWRVK